MSASTVAIAAAAAFRGTTLFVQYSTVSNNLGTLFALTPSSNSSSTFLIQPQTVSGPSSLGPSRALTTLVTASLVSTTTLDPLAGFRHDLLLIINAPTPFFFRLTPISPNIGDGLSRGPPESSSWTLSDQSQSFNTTPSLLQMSLASATKDTSAGQASSEGSAVYELFVNTTSISTIKVDVSETTGVPYHPILKFSSMSLSTATPPKIVRLTDSGPYDVVVVGSCASPASGICLTFIGALEASTLQTPMPYDPTSCIVHANGSVIVATTSGVWTYPYAGTLQPGANWTAHQAPSLKPNLPSPILACATSNSKLYAILQGDEETPSVRSIDMTSQNWDWQAVQLLKTAGSGTIPASPTAANGNGGTGNDADVSGNKSISSAVIAVIIAVSVIVVLLILMALIWRYRRIRRKNRLGMGQIDKTIVAPVPFTGHSQPYGEPSTMGAAVLGSAGHHQPNATYNSNASDSRTVTTPSPTPINTSRPWTPQGSFTATSVHTPLRSAVIAGDKEEIDNEDQHWRSESAASSYTSNISHGIVQHPGGAVKPSIAANNNSRMQQALSPGLTNAQLILQQSQAPKNSSAPPDSNYYRR